jgi:hypothetical protein
LPKVRPKRTLPKPPAADIPPTEARMPDMQIVPQAACELPNTRTRAQRDASTQTDVDVPTHTDGSTQTDVDVSTHPHEPQPAVGMPQTAEHRVPQVGPQLPPGHHTARPASWDTVIEWQEI